MFILWPEIPDFNGDTDLELKLFTESTVNSGVSHRPVVCFCLFTWKTR